LALVFDAGLIGAQKVRSRRMSESSTRASRMVAVIGILILICSGCAQSVGVVTTEARAPLLAAASSADAPDPLAPLSSQRVARGDALPAAALTGTDGGFSAGKPVVYLDGISLTVDRYRHGVEHGNGPGVFNGRPYTVVTLTLRNGSARPVRLDQVVVSATYGLPARVAPAVYEDSAVNDFSGELRSGNSSSGTYAFAIPPKQRHTVVLTVDFDGSHLPGSFTGGTP
jgi:hypothetical protein